MAKHRRKDLRHDEFKETVEKIIILYEHHKKAVLWITAAVVILLITLFTYKNNKQREVAQSKEIYNMGVILYNSGNFIQARAKFQEVVDKYWGTTFVNRSKFMLANISYKEGNLDDALEKFQDFVNGTYDELFTPSAHQGIGQCYEQKGELDKAVKNYEAAVDKFKDDFAKAECFLALSRLYLNQQKTGEAEIVLKKVFDISEDAEILEKAEEKLKLVQIQKEFNE